jgi:hypothetical protein
MIQSDRSRLPTTQKKKKQTWQIVFRSPCGVACMRSFGHDFRKSHCWLEFTEGIKQLPLSLLILSYYFF